MIELVAGAALVLITGPWLAWDLWHKRQRRRAREQPATLEGGGSHLSGVYKLP